MDRAEPGRGSSERVPILCASSVTVTYTTHAEPSHRSLKGLLTGARHRNPPRRLIGVRDVSFTLHEGEALGLVGLNGSGKSTLLKALAGLLPFSGAISARAEPVLLGVGAVLHPDLSGRRNIMLGGTALGLTRREVDSLYDEIVDFAGVRDSIDFPLRTYSSGMNARLRFAIAAAVEPDILLIDEALAVGDESFRRRSEERIRGLVSRAGALVLVSHSLGSIEEICDRVIWMHGGRVKRDGSPQEVVHEYREFASGAGK
jgi:teichoic acid transport system ATP-binding protein